MIYALHGNFGQPQDWLEVLKNVSAEQLKPFMGTHGFELWNLYNNIEVSSEIFAQKLNEDARKSRKSKTSKNLILGYSLGGRLAIEAIVQQPEIWDAAIIVSAHTGLQTEEERRLRIEEDSMWAREVLTTPWPEFWKKWCSQPVLANSPWGADLVEPPSDVLKIASVFKNFSLGQQKNSQEFLGHLSLPVLWVYGENDSKYKDLYSGLEALNPAFETFGVRGSGHRVLHEKAEILAERIHAFLEGCFRVKN